MQDHTPRAPYPLAATLVAALLAACASEGGPGTAAAGALPHEGATSLDGRRVANLDTGGAATPIVLVHGWASDRSVFRRQVEGLRERFRLLAVDLPGHGQSEEPAAPYSMDLFARGVAAVMDDAGVERAVLVGHSNGTPVVRQFYRLFPERTRALVVIDGTLQRMFDDTTAAQVVPGFESPQYREVLERFLGQLGLEGALADEVRAMAFRQPQHAVVGGLVAALDPTIWDDDPIDVPLLLLLARQPAWSDAYEDHVRSIAPHVDYRVLDGVSHFFLLERPDYVNDAIAELVTSLDAG